MSENGNGNGELTGLQEAFVDALFKHRFNRTKAAKEAGYEGSYAALASRGSRLAKMDKIKAAVRERWREEHGSPEEVLAWLFKIVRAPGAEAFVTDSGRSLDAQVVSDFGEMVHRCKVGQWGWEVQTYSKLEALKELVKVLEMLPAQEHEHTGDIVHRMMFAKPPELEDG